MQKLENFFILSLEFSKLNTTYWQTFFSLKIQFSVDLIDFEN